MTFVVLVGRLAGGLALQSSSESRALLRKVIIRREVA